MATLVSLPVRYIATEWEKAYASAVLSGIVPDERHLEDGGFHCSIEDLIRFGNRNDYSNLRIDDKGWNPKYGAAIDMSMSPADMKLCFQRIKAVFDDRTDPRRKYINAFNCWDGVGSADRLDFVTSTWGTSSSDHKWHNHSEHKRRYLLDWDMAYAVVSMLRGETKQKYIESGGDEVDWNEKVSIKLPDGKTYEYPIKDWIGGGNYYGNKAAAAAEAIRAEVAALTKIVQSLADIIKTGGGDVNIPALLEGMKTQLEEHRKAVRADTRDAVADAEEGGAARVRAEEPGPS